MLRGIQQFAESLTRAQDPDAEVNAGWGMSVALLFLCFVAIGLVTTRSTLDGPFIWDDLHLIRVHTPQELAQVWSGNWDPDNIETAGFRPLTVYFNHVRALAFGESTAAHRIFLLILFSLFLTMSGLLARRLFGATFLQVLLAGSLTFLHIANVYNYFWISDGVHLLSGILIMGGLLCLLTALLSGRWIWLGASLLCSALALLTREDSLVVYPLVFWFALGFRRIQQEYGRPAALPRRALILFAGCMLLILAIYWYWRRAAVPGAEPAKLDPLGLLWAATRIVQNAGDRGDLIYPWRRYLFVIWLWYVWLGALVIVGAFKLKLAQQKQLLFWGGAILLAGLPIMVVARANLLLLPVTFWGLLVATVLTGFWNSSTEPLPRVIALGMAAVALAAPTYGSLVFRQEQRTNNLVLICVNADYEFNTAATIPEARRRLVQEYLSPYGISSRSSLNDRYPALVRQARIEASFGLNQRGLPFIPIFQFVPTFPYQWYCLANPRRG